MDGSDCTVHVDLMAREEPDLSLIGNRRFKRPSMKMDYVLMMLEGL
jgi:hypothetical protein